MIFFGLLVKSTVSKILRSLLMSRSFPLVEIHLRFRLSSTRLMTHRSHYHHKVMTLSSMSYMILWKTIKISFLKWIKKSNSKSLIRKNYFPFLSTCRRDKRNLSPNSGRNNGIFSQTFSEYHGIITMKLSSIWKKKLLSSTMKISFQEF
jgi:hypothetical protein